MDVVFIGQSLALSCRSGPCALMSYLWDKFNTRTEPFYFGFGPDLTVSIDLEGEIDSRFWWHFGSIFHSTHPHRIGYPLLNQSEVSLASWRFSLTVVIIKWREESLCRNFLIFWEKYSHLR